MTINDISQSYMQSALINVATGNRINSAADDAAGLAISEMMESEVRGYEQGSRNAENMQGLLKTAEGGLSTISDALNRIREISVQANNATYTDSDKAIMQMEVQQMKDHIKSVTGMTEFNTIKLLDGESKELHTASSPDGGGMVAGIPDINEMLKGLEDYDVTKKIDLDFLDSSLDAVSEVRAQIGSQINRLDHTVNSNSITMLNLQAAKSRIADADMGKSISEWSKQQVLSDMQVYSARMKMEQMKQGPVSMLL